MGSKGSSFSEGENRAKFGPGSCHKVGMRLKLCLGQKHTHTHTIWVTAKRIDTDTFMTCSFIRESGDTVQ